MSATNPSSPPADVACHVIRIGYSSNSNRVSGDSPTLDPAVLRGILDQTQDWENDRKTAWYLRNRARELGLQGLALIWNATPFPPPKDKLAALAPAYLNVPPPLQVPFEPLRLDDSDSRVAELFGQGNDTFQTSTARNPSPPAARGGWRGAKVVVGLGLGFWILFLLMIFPATGGGRPSSCCCGWLSILPIALTIWFWPRAHAWFIVPGGLMIRHTPLLFGPTRLDIRCPANTVIIMHPRPPGWKVTLTSTNRIESAHLTQAECLALLRAWQSPIPPPSAEQMEDWR